MAFRRITAYVVPLGVIFIAFVGFAALSTSGDTGPSAAVNTVDQTELPVRARVAAAVFAARFETNLEEEAAVTAETRAAAPTTTTSAPTTASATATTPRDTEPPAFRITSPNDGAEVDTRVVRFEGTVEPGADVFTGRFFATVTEEGDWELPLTLLPGANIARITASDPAGNETTVRLIVNYTPPKSTTTTNPPRKSTTTTTKAPAKTTTTTKASATTTTQPASEWSPNWPADAGGTRNVEQWRSEVEAHWPANRVDCVLGIIKKESRGDPRARNTAHDTRGLMQHLIKYWKGRATGAGFIDGNGLVANPYNGEANIAAGAYLADYYDRLGKNWWSPWGGLPSYGSCGS
jgi:hypothetical protein